MAEFTQEQLDKLLPIAVDFIREDSPTPCKGLYLEMQGDRAIFGVWFVHPPKVKAGLPMYVSISLDGDCFEIRDHKERNRLLRKLNELRKRS